MSKISERVESIVVKLFAVDPVKVVDSASFIGDLGADRLDTVELMVTLEQEFGCTISDDDAQAILTVGDAVKFLEKNASILATDAQPRSEGELTSGSHGGKQ